MTAREPGADGARAAEEEAPQAPAKPLDELHELRKGLEEERARAEGNLAGWQRAQADFSNYRRRVEQERADTARYAGAAILIQVLPVVDDLERALAVVPASLMQLTWVDGIYLIYRKLITALEAQGVREIPALDQAFDPNIHEAVLHGEGPEGRVGQVLQKGYLLHDRVLRPALVQVGKGPAPQPSAETPASVEGSGAADPGA